MKIAKINSLGLQNKKNILKKVEIGIASLAMGSLLSCTPALAQEPKADEVNIENKQETNKNNSVFKELLVVLGSTAVLFGLLEYMGYALTKTPDKNKKQDLNNFKHETFRNSMGK